jgi:hypothetical protein
MNVIKYKNKQKEWHTATKPLSILIHEGKGGELNQKWRGATGVTNHKAGLKIPT